MNYLDIDSYDMGVAYINELEKTKKQSIKNRDDRYHSDNIQQFVQFLINKLYKINFISKGKANSLLKEIGTTFFSVDSWLSGKGLNEEALWDFLIEELEPFIEKNKKRISPLQLSNKSESFKKEVYSLLDKLDDPYYKNIGKYSLSDDGIYINLGITNKDDLYANVMITLVGDSFQLDAILSRDKNGKRTESIDEYYPQYFTVDNAKEVVEQVLNYYYDIGSHAPIRYK